MTPGKKRVLGGESDSGEFWNPWTSPVEALELLHYMDKEDARGEPPSKQELSDFHAWLDKGASVRLSDHRIAQLYLRYLDDSLGPAASSVGKILRISEGQAPALRELEKQADSVDLLLEGGFSEHVRALDHWIEELCIEGFISVAPRIVERWKNVRVLLVDEGRSQKVYDYLEEASGTYIYGHFRGSIVLCRASLELALKNILGHPPGSEHELKELIDQAERERLLVGRYKRFADQVRRTANDIVHPKREATEGLAQEILNLTGEVIENMLGYCYHNPYC